MLGLKLNHVSKKGPQGISMASEILVNIGSGNSLLSDTKPLPERILKHH